MKTQRDLIFTAFLWFTAFAAVAAGWFVFAENGQKPWTMPIFALPEATDPGAPSAGVLLDAFGLLASTVAFWVGLGTFLVSRHASMGAVATLGAVVAWMASTQWLALVGCTVSTLAGFLSFQNRWNEVEGSSAASLYVKEKSFGLLIAFIGLAVWSVAAPGSLFGGYALLAGCWFLFPGFPFLGGIAEESEPEEAGNLIIQRILPALATSAVFVRFLSAQSSLTNFVEVGWVGVGMAVLASIYGLMSEGWKTALAAWIAACASIGVSIMTFAGARSGVLYFIGMTLAAASMAIAGGALEQGTSRPAWAKAGATIGALLGVSFAGFVTSKPWVVLLAQAWKLDETGFIAALGLPLLGVSLLGWKVLWSLLRASQLERAAGPSWQAAAFSIPVALSGAGLIWTGELSGGLSLESADQVAQSLMDALVGTESPAGRPDAGAWNMALAVCGGIWLVGGLAGYWLSGAKDRWAALRLAFPGFSRFIAQGLGARLVGAAFMRGVRITGESTSEWVDGKLWERWLPLAFGGATRFGGGLAARIDSAVSLKVSRALRRKAEVPAKLLQLIQNGDVQWYLLFALATGMAMLAHFMRTVG